MPVKIIDRVYTHLGRPGDTNIKLLIGNVGVWQKLTLTCELEVAINFTTTNVLFMEEPNIFTLGDGSEWKEQGFEVGDDFEVKWALTDSSNVTQVYTVTGIIQNINGSIMTSNNTTLGGGAQASNIYPYQGANVKAHSVFIRTNKRPKSIGFQYGHLKNSEVDSFNLNSFIDGTATKFYSSNIDAMTIGQIKDFDFVGNQSGMSVASCKLAYMGQANTKYFYSIEIIFMISSFFDDLNNFINKVNTSVTYGKECLTDGFMIVGFLHNNNPNITIKNNSNASKKLGNTGWFNENFNGLKNPFTVSSVIYLNSSSTIVPQLDYANPILVTAVIDGVQNLSSSTRCMYGFGLVPIVEEDYKSQPQGNQYTTGYHQNTLINTGGTASSFADVFNVSNIIDTTLRQGYTNQSARMDVQNVRFQQTGLNQITFQAEFVPNADFVSLMESKDISERNYILWVSVADQTKITNESDRVSLLLDFKQLDTFIEPIGAFSGMEITFFDHTQDETSEVCPCNQDWRIEDEVLSMIDFRIDTAQANNIPIPTALTYGVVIKRNSDDFSYLLDRYKIDLTQYPNPTQYNFDASKAFKLPIGNNKNFIKVDYYPPLDTGTEKGIRGFYAFKIRWEDWLPRLGVPQEVINDFYDNTKKADGLNNDWYNYLTNAGWITSFVVYIDAQLNGKHVVYENLKELNFVDYNANNNVTTELRYYRQSDNTQLIGGTDLETGKPLGVILKNELVRLEIDYTLTVGTWGSLSNIYGINAIEVFEGAGQLEYRQLSTEYASELGNPLLPLTGDTVLDVQLVNPSTLRCSCLIDYQKLNPATKYKITGREGCKNINCNSPSIVLSSSRATTTNSSSESKYLIAAPNVNPSPDHFSFLIDAKNEDGSSYTGNFEITAIAKRKDGSIFSLGKALYNNSQNANNIPHLSDSVWRSWGGGLGLNNYLTGNWSDGGTISFQKITFSKNNSDPKLTSLGILQNENAVEIQFNIVIQENCINSIGYGGKVLFVQTKGNSENNGNFELIGYTNTDWQTQREADLFLAARGVGFVRDFYVDLHADADYYFAGFGINETISGGGDKAVKLSEVTKDRSGQNWRNIWSYSDKSFSLAAVRGNFGSDTSTRVVYGCQLDYKDSLNVHNGTQYPVLFTTGSGTSDASSGRFGFVQPITGYTDGEDSNYNNTKGMPIFGESQTVIGTGANFPSQLQIHCVIDDWRHNDRPIVLFYALSTAGIGLQYNSGTYASTSYSTVTNAAALGIIGVADTVHYSKADGCIYAYTREVTGGTTTQRLYRITYNGASNAHNIASNYSATLLMQFSYSTGTELTRNLAQTIGTFDTYPHGLSNFLPSDNLMFNGYPVFYIQDIWGNCLVELKNNGGQTNTALDWNYKVVAGIFGHGQSVPSRASGIAFAAEFDFVGALNNVNKIALTGSSYFRMFDGYVYIAIRHQGQFIRYNPENQEVFYLSGEYGDSFNEPLYIV